MKKKSRAFRIILGIFVFLLSLVVVLLIVLQAGMMAAHAWSPWVPGYDKIDLSSILSEEELSAEDYETLYRQTGLTRLGVDGLLERGEEEEILAIQEDFFAGYEYYSDGFGPFTCSEKLRKADGVHFAALEEGDVIVTPSTHFSFVRFGHCMLVVDGENGGLLNSFGYDTPSGIAGTEHFNRRPAFLILRPKADEATRRAVAEYAVNELTGIGYSVLAGLFGGQFDENAPPSVTQCAHIVWYAFMHFGIDIDSNGGWLVLPRDIALSDCFDLVQVYGFDPDELWA